MPTYFRSDQFVKSSVGPAVAGAQVFWCTPQPTNITFPPSPLATVYSDPNGLIPLQQPAICDGFGHCSAYMLPGIYTVVVALGGTVQNFYPDQALGLGNAGPGNPYTAGSNISIVGPVISAVIPPGIVVETNGVPNSNQNLLNFQNSATVTFTQSGGTLSAAASPPTALQTLSSIHVAVATGTTFPGIGIETQNNGLNSFEQPNTIQVGEGASALFLTSGSGGNFCQSGESYGALSLDSVAASQARLALSQLTDIRAWVGMSANYQSTLQADQPSTALAAFRYSVNAGDTTWKAVTQSSGGAGQTVIDTLVTADTKFHTFAVVPVGASVTFYIDGVLVATSTTNLPTGTSALHFTVFADNIAFAAAVGFYLEYYTWRNNN